MDEERRVALGNLLKELFRITFTKPSSTSLYSAYEPADLDVLQRIATYSANLLLLIIVVAGEVTASALFPGSEDAVNAWRRAAMLWRAALPEQGWLWLVTSLDLRRIVSLEQRDILAALSNHERAPVVQPVDLFWTYDAMTLHESEWAVLYGSEDWRWQSEAFLVTDVNDDVMAHALEPLLPKLSTSVTTIVDIGGQGISAAHALIRLWVASTMEASRDELAAAYEDCIDIALHAFQAFDHDRSIYRGIILHLLSVDRNRLPGSWRESTRQKLAAEYNDQSETGRTFCERVIVKLGFKPM